ncbi:Uncharacterised protein [Amycolatopsis camponoti]|uniref:Uncharacterized protein n=1 Tax=Amycolatopsis camponoti TaxID=2606593 RepID=A0A6I8LTY5_9PSEU|nr:hypothetical protein [Amycolatopsis camponoti]VVJ20572.1 Uncharacterised protein [Amycolatopsis camponoti]
MSSKTVMPTAALRSPLPTAGSVGWLYLTVFASIGVLAWVIQFEGVAFLIALPAASGVATVAVSLVNCLLGKDYGACVSASSPRPGDVRPRR